MPQVGQAVAKLWLIGKPENPEFWEKFGKKIAKQNLVISTIALTLSFCVWYLWATIAAEAAHEKRRLHKPWTSVTVYP